MRQIVIPTEQVSEIKDGQKVADRAPDDARLRARQHGPQRGLLGPRQGNARRHRLRRRAQNKPVPLNQAEIDRLLNRETAERAAHAAQFSIGESVKVVSGPLSDFSGEISEINEDAAKLKVLVSIFGRETPVEVGFDQVKKI